MISKFSESALNGLLNLASKLLPEVIAVGKRDFGELDPDWSDRACAIFGIFCIDSSEGLIQERRALIGGRGDRTTNYARRFQYVGYCHEKANRLYLNALQFNHLTSYLSRDPSADQWGGAVIITFPGVGSRYILSCSGLPEKADEVFCLLVALLAHPDSPELLRYVKLLANNSDNEYWDPFYAVAMKLSYAAVA